MNIITDMSEVTELATALNQLPLDVNKNVLRASLKKSLNPTYERAKNYVPVGKKTTFGYGGAYERGGATKRSIRIAIREDRSNTSELVGLVGVSQKKNAVGWRTHFITMLHHTRDSGTKFGKKGKFGINVSQKRRSVTQILQKGHDFLKRASVGTVQEVESTLAIDITKVVQRRLKRLRNKIRI